MEADRIRTDFDEIAELDAVWRIDRYDGFLRSLVPPAAARVLDLGCGLGRVTAPLAQDGRDVLGVDLSPRMVERAREASRGRASYVCGDFLRLDLPREGFDCVVSVATLHHLRVEEAIPRMVDLLRPGGRLILHDLRRDTTLGQTARAKMALGRLALTHLVRTGRLRSPRAIREVWERHVAGESYLSMGEVRALARRMLPGARLIEHWLSRYTLAWDRP